MPVSLPYLSSNKNVAELFGRIASAAVPPKFTQDFLQNTIGLKGTNDRNMIPLLRNMGFLDQSNTPTTAYSLLKAKDKQKVAIAIADGVRLAYAPLFNADEGAGDLSGGSLKGLVAQVAGTDDDMTNRIAATFSAVAKLGNFKAVQPPPEKDDKGKGSGRTEEDGDGGENSGGRVKGLRTEFQYVIQVQLPSNGTEETYLNIFNAIRKTFQ